jgi:hypothetical protein
MSWLGEWQPGIDYKINDAVAHNGSSFICLQPGSGHEPKFQTPFWDVLAAKGDDGRNGIGMRGEKGDPGENGTGGGGSASLTETLENVNAGSIAIGQVVYISGAGDVDLAQADNPATAKAFGLVADASIASLVSGEIQLEGVLTATTGEWDAVTGQTGGLTAGAIYYLDPTTPGAMTTTAPTSGGEYVVELGKAVSSTKFDITIRRPIRL